MSRANRVKGTTHSFTRVKLKKKKINKRLMLKRNMQTILGEIEKGESNIAGIKTKVTYTQWSSATANSNRSISNIAEQRDAVAALSSAVKPTRAAKCRHSSRAQAVANFNAARMLVGNVAYSCAPIEQSVIRKRTALMQHLLLSRKIAFAHDLSASSKL